MEAPRTLACSPATGATINPETRARIRGGGETPHTVASNMPSYGEKNPCFAEFLTLPLPVPPSPLPTPTYIPFWLQ